MYRFFKLLMSLTLLVGLTPLCVANPIAAVPTPPQIDAQAYILIDSHSGKVLAEKEPHKRIDPASLTKMMTVYVFDHELQNGHFTLEDEIPVSENAWKTEGSRMFTPVGKKIKASDLLRGIIIQSGNDATVALAEYVAGSEKAFADVMNQYAKRLGMKDTHFTNSTGIPDPEHYSTAYDLSLLAKALIEQFPETYKIYSEKWFTFNGIKQPNRNRLLWREPFIDGIKTGHSSTAGYCLAASGQKDNMRLISVLVGADSESARTEQTLQLLRFGFRFFETHHLYQAYTPLKEPRVWMGDRKKLALGINQDLYITIPQGQYKSLDAKISIDKSLTAPIAKGQNYGTLIVKLGQELIAELPLIALENIGKGSMWERFSDYVSLAVQKMINPKADEASGTNEQLSKG